MANGLAKNQQTLMVKKKGMTEILCAKRHWETIDTDAATTIANPVTDAF